MSLKFDDLETFKKHRNEISESLSNRFVGRVCEIDVICNLLLKKDFVVITGSAGIGKSRLAVAAIEKYIAENKNYTVLCVKNFGDYISALEESIDDSMECLFFIDDAYDFKRLHEVIECLKYHRGNVKAVFTVRDYLKDCIDDDTIFVYKIGFLSEDEVKKAIEENTPIKNKILLNKIANVSKGNIRFAFVAADVALNDEKGFASLLNINDVMDSFYKGQIAKMCCSSNLVKVAGIISFFKSVYLKQLFYISPVLKIADISKQEFLRCVDVLISMELVDESLSVVKIADQCFAEYLLNYVFLEKKYLKVKDLIVSTYKYFNKKIIETLNSILSTHLDKDSFSYLKKEAINSCNSIEDVELKHGIEVALAPLALDFAAQEFKNGVESYTDSQDIKWLLDLFNVLAKTNYQSVANEGVMRLLSKTKAKQADVFIAINETYLLDYDDVQSFFSYLDSFVAYLMEQGIRDKRFMLLVSSYLKYSFKNSKYVDEKKVELFSFNVNDDMIGIIPFRRRCWDYLFSYGIENTLDSIINFARCHISEGLNKILRLDLDAINEHLEGFGDKELIQAVIYEEFKKDIKDYNLNDMLFYSTKYNGVLGIVLERESQDQDCEKFRKTHEEAVHGFYTANKKDLLELLKDIEPISRYYEQNIKNFLSVVLEFLDEFSMPILNVFIRYKVYPLTVVEKAASILEYDSLYEKIKSISDVSMRDEYLYAFYTFINNHDIDSNYEFDKWIKEKVDSGVKPVFPRNLLYLRKIAENSGITYVELVKTVFKKKKYNEVMTKGYLSFLLFNVRAFKELLELDKKLAISIYEFLISQSEKDFGNKILKEIIKSERNYIKVFAKRYLESGVADEGGLEEIIYEGDNCKLFFDTCINIGEKKLPYFVPFNLQQFVSHNLGRQEMLDWILGYIDKKHKNNRAMESLFSVLAGIDSGFRNRFIAKYYEKGKDEEVLRCALINSHQSYFLDSAEPYLKAEISKLESLKLDLINWENMNLISFIDEVIKDYDVKIEKGKISQLIEYVDPSILKELQELDYKTEISLSDAFKLYLDDEDFRKLLSSGYLAYEDGCFMTKLGVPLKFADIIKDRKIIGIKVIQTANDSAVKFDQLLTSMKVIARRTKEGNQITLDEHLCSLFIDKGWSANDFMEETALTRDFFSKIKNKHKEKLEKKTLVQILIGLKLPKVERDYLLEKNGTQLSVYREEDVLYEFLLASGVDIDTADTLFKKLGKNGFIKKYQD